MRRILLWVGLLVMTISFVWFVAPSKPTHLIAKPRNPPVRTSVRQVVVLDPGHGGQDSGAMCGPVLEKDLTLDVALRAATLLRAAGYAMVLTRDDDRYLSLAERAAVGNRAENSLFVSIHFNDDARPGASGVETYYAECQSVSRFGFLSWLPFLRPPEDEPLTAKSESLARFLQAALVKQTSALDRGTKRERFYVIANARNPAALVEGGFITNKSDVTKLATTEYRQQIASAISDGVHRYGNAIKAGEPTLTLAAAPSE